VYRPKNEWRDRLLGIVTTVQVGNYQDRNKKIPSRR
jgi:hypothetical protein